MEIVKKAKDNQPSHCAETADCQSRFVCSDLPFAIRAISFASRAVSLARLAGSLASRSISPGKHFKSFANRSILLSKPGVRLKYQN